MVDELYPAGRPCSAEASAKAEQAGFNLGDFNYVTNYSQDPDVYRVHWDSFQLSLSRPEWSG